MTEEKLISWFNGVKFYQQSERVRLIKEIGSNLGTSMTEFIQSCKKSASNLVKKITQNFSGFRDHSIYNGRQVFFYKRAQICVGDIFGSFGGKGLGEFHDIGDLTMFADYRVPQILYHMGVIEYSSELKKRKLNHSKKLKQDQKKKLR